MLDERVALTVPEAARRVRRNPETVRRWIRAGKLRSRRVGTQHLVDPDEVEALAAPVARALPVPDGDKMTPWGVTEQQLADEIVAMIRRHRGPLYSVTE